jgi:cardiolipin synthase A/B
MSVREFFQRRRRAWTAGNAFELLENGEGYYPAVFDAIAGAEHEVLVETFILFEDKVGFQLRQALITAARRGARVDLTVDGWGTPELSREYLQPLLDAGVGVRAFDPRRRLFGMRLHAFRRMHRKLVVVDGRTAFAGGINFSADHLADYGKEAKQDYAVRFTGPLVARVRTFMLGQIGQRRRPAPPAQAIAHGHMEAMFVIRDNGLHRDDIEREYRAAIRAAREEVVIANAYFFPGYRLLKALRRAAGRGVKVRLILQGQPDMAIVKAAAELLHRRLLGAGVEIHDYCERPLHGKVAVIDGMWCTVGSSNLDPLSLALNLEANVIVRDRAFSAVLRERLDVLMRHHCKRLEPQAIEQRAGRWRVWVETLAYHLTRRFPAWVGWLPAHTPVVKPVAPVADAPSPPTVVHAQHEREAT